MSEQAVLIWHQYRFERRMFWRNPSAAFFNFLLPLLFLAFFGAIFSSSQEDLDVIVPGIAGMSVMSTTFSAFAFQLTFLREQGILKRMRGTPLPSTSYIAGLSLSAVTNTLIQVAIITLSGKLFFGIEWPKDWTELIVFVFLGASCFAVLGFALAAVIPNFASAPAYVNAVFLPMIFISGVFYDANNAPGFLRELANVMPLKHLIDGLSSAMVTGKSFSSLWVALTVVAAWGAAGLLFTLRRFRWDNGSE